MDSGKRGQSNLPAWMTAAGTAGVTTQDEPASKRAKTTTANLDKTLLRSYVAQQITHYMGVEEETLIDFCVQHVLDEKPWEDLANELQQVLEEDTGAFLQALQAKIKRIGWWWGMRGQFVVFHQQKVGLFTLSNKVNC
jgi:hypothetical protein